jgi:tetratricopeptide (TPR) repeat protein
MNRHLIFLFFISTQTLLIAQDVGLKYVDEGHYLFDSLSIEGLGEYDKNLLDSGLEMYHKAKTDTARINALVFISEEIYDPIWFQYNVFLKEECEDRLKNSSLTPKLFKFYKSILAGTINNYGYYNSNRGRPIEAMRYYKESLKILQEIGNRKASAQSLGNIGFQFHEIGEIDSSLVYHHKSLEIEREFDDFSGMGNAYNNLASIYMDRSDIKAALSYYDSAMKIYVDLQDKGGLALILNNIAITYLDQNEDSLARVFLMKSMEIREELGDKRGLAGVLNNIGTLYNKPGNRNEAMDYFQRSLEISEELQDSDGMAASLSHLGNLYSDLDDLEKALEFHQKAYNLRLQSKGKEGISFSLSSLAKIYLALGQIQKALEAGKESLRLAKELGFTENIESAALVLHNIYHQQSNWKKALEMHKLYIYMRDSIFNQYTKKEAVKRQMKHEFEKREAIKNAENAKQLEIMAEREEKQKMVSLGSGMGLVIVVFFSIFVYNKLKESLRQKRIIEIQKKEAEEIHEALAMKNKEVMDSIQYAKRIQHALLKSEEYETRHLPEHFILFIPKDIVSGDFYWAMEKEQYFYFAAADCTGHGVPGAFLTMLGTSFLNEINATEELLTPAVMLEALREKIIKELSQAGGEEDTKDGMDISMMRLNLNTLDMDWTGAHNPLYHIRDGKLKVIKPDKQPIGYHEYMTPFTNHKLKLKKGDLVYLFTDGYADQFGGANGKKFMYKKFKEKILAISSIPLDDQKEELRKTFYDWKGDLEQVDDVCVIGLKV